MICNNKTESVKGAFTKEGSCPLINKQQPAPESVVELSCRTDYGIELLRARRKGRRAVSEANR